MKKSSIILATIALPLDFLMLFLAGLSAYFLRFNDFFTKIKPIIFNLSFDKYLPIMFSVIMGWLVLFALAGLYSSKPTRRLTSELSRVVFACSTGLAAITIYLFFRLDAFNSRFIVLAGWILGIIYVSCGRIALKIIKNLLYRSGIGTKKIAIIGTGRVSDMIAETLRQRRGFGFMVAGQYPNFNQSTIADLNELLAKKQLDDILLTSPKTDENEVLAILNFCQENHLDFKYSADLFSTYLANISIYAVGGIPIVEMHKTKLQAWGRVTKRSMDLVGSIILIILTSPLLLFSALAVLLETGWPVIYKNERVGEAGKKIMVLKFRSMYQKYCIGAQFKNQTEALNFEQELIKTKSIKGGPIYKIKDDPRITKVGKILRRLSLDELPQLFNVLVGNLSLVGPRPHQPREVDLYSTRQRKVLNIKPGLSGLSQISGRSDLEFEEEVTLDTLYIENWSLLLDLIILLKTPFILFKSRKAL